MDTWKMVLFATVASSVLFFGTAYVGLRIASFIPHRWRWLFWLGLGVLFVLMPAAFMLMRAPADAFWHRAVYLLGFSFVGVLSLLFAGFLLVDLGRGVLALSDRVASMLGQSKPSTWVTPDDPQRRAFLANALRLTVVAGAAAITGWGFFNVRRRVEIVPVDVPIENLPPALDGFKIAQLTDLHISPDIRRPFVEEVVASVNNLDADLIAFTGDLADGQVAALLEDSEPLAGLASRHGTYFVNGNHEFYSDYPGWAARIDELGMRNLVNAHTVIDHDGGRLVLAGVNDVQASQMEGVESPDYDKTFASAPGDVPRILMCHNPMLAKKALDRNLDLILCGHTHGGQYAPWTGAVKVIMPYSCGLYSEGKTQIYTSRGTGYWGPPIRTNGPGEVTLLTLRSA